MIFGANDENPLVKLCKYYNLELEDITFMRSETYIEQNDGSIFPATEAEIHKSWELVEKVI